MKDPENVLIYDEEYVLPNPSIKEAGIGMVVTSLVLLLVSIFILSSLNPYPEPIFGSVLLVLSIISGIVSICLFVKHYDKNNN